jgi:hypothetical protein
MCGQPSLASTYTPTNITDKFLNRLNGLIHYDFTVYSNISTATRAKHPALRCRFNAKRSVVAIPVI